jgi:hypothetical protein
MRRSHSALGLGLLLALVAACSYDELARAGAPGREAAPTGERWTPQALAFFTGQRADPDVRHVHLMHLDGFHSALFEELLAADMLPHFAFLLERGKLSTVASTVDKSETFKVIQAYLTSRLDTQVTGWWQWSRHELRFRNFWLDPVEVANYALGLEFPLHPSVFDVVAARGGNVAAGFSLHRRSVPFQNYSRNYVEGARAAYDHTYLAQAHATMSSFLVILERIARNRGESLPAFSMSLLAATDEFAHLDGMVQPRGAADGDSGTACFTRKPRAERERDPAEALFAILDEDWSRSGRLRRLYHRGLSSEEIASGGGSGYFTRVERAGGETRRLCIRVPLFETIASPETEPGGEIGAKPGVALGTQPAALPDEEPGVALGTPRLERAAPRVVLAMIQTDIELGRLIDGLRAIRFEPDGRRVFDPSAGNGIVAYVEGGRPESSLFEKTLFIALGDHGDVDTPRKMSRPDPQHPDPRRHPDSMDVGLLEYMNGELGLETPWRRSVLAPGATIGIDDQHLPARLAFPHRDPSWQPPEVRHLVTASERWAAEFFAEVEDVFRSELYTKYWWLLWLRKLLVDPRLDKVVEPIRETAVATLAELHLRGEPDYVRAERRAARSFYDEHVRVVYGGGARNNAELFLPTWRSGSPSWGERPGFDEIANGPGAPVLRALERLPSVGLIFVREQNGSLGSGRPLPPRMVIRVRDHAGNAGAITVRPDADTGVLLYHYRVDAESAADPLDYGEVGLGKGTWGTYAEWNDRSVERGDVYHNAVAGMGSYLYSTNPSIGDITLMHASGWNFGGNSAGHGGLHRGEKLSVMLVSGPGIAPGALMASARHASRDGRVVPTRAATHPTVLDVAPTALAWLGFDETALADFEQQGFPEHLQAWVAAQRDDLLGNLDEVENLNEALRDAGFAELRISRFRERLARLLAFLPDAPPPLPDPSGAGAQGNRLSLD